MTLTNLKKDFPWFKNNPKYTYLDSAATALKPKCVIDSITEYYSKYSTNPHNTDSLFSYKTYKNIEIDIRQKIASYFNCESKEIIYTSGATESLCLFAFGLRKFIKKNEEVLLTNHEHTSNIIPWLQIKKDFNLNVRFIDFKKELPSEEKIIKLIKKNTKVLSFCNVSNLYGYELDVKKISTAARKINKNIIIIVDAAQAVSHHIIDLKSWNIDFMAVSAHKMFGPTGIGCAYINTKWLDKLDPIKLGGSMNSDVTQENFTYAEPPYKFEGGTLNISGIIGWGAAIDYINKIGMQNITKRIVELKKYADKKLKTIPNLIYYNLGVLAPTLIFNFKGVNSQDLASYLGNKNIIVRSGVSCSKLIKCSTNVEAYVRASLGVYNDYQDIDNLARALKSFKKGDELSHVI